MRARSLPQMTARADRQHGRIAAVVCLLLLAVPSACLARLPQSASASVVCVVQDANGAPLPGTSVTLKSLDTGLTRQKQTDREGSAQFPNVPPGRYELELAHGSFRPVKTSFELRLDEPRRLPFTMLVAT